MKLLLTLSAALLSTISVIGANRVAPIEGSAAKHRLIVLADMGNEHDEQQQMMHLMLYANEFDIEGLIAVTGKYLHPNYPIERRRRLYPELFHLIINGYAVAYPNLVKHAKGYPTPNYLRSIVTVGQFGYGSKAVGEGLSSEGSRLIVNSFERDDPRSIFIVVNAGSNTLAQALYDYQQSHSEEEMNRVISKLRVFENGAQDDAGAMICSRYPAIEWVRSNYQAYCYGGGGYRSEDLQNKLGPYTWEPYEYSSLGQHFWALEHIMSGNGDFGACFPLRLSPDGRIVTLEGGGTIPWLCLINKGLSDIQHPEWGGWSGRYSREKRENYWSRHKDVRGQESEYAPFALYGEERDRWQDPESGVVYDNLYAPVWRWRRAFYNDFKYRMDWCKGSVEEVNHNPIAAVNGDCSDAILYKVVRRGERVTLDASQSSDPDGDELRYSWFYYPEAGTYGGEVEVVAADKESAEIVIPDDCCSGDEIHIILELTDGERKEAMFDYRRVVLRVK